MSNSPLALAGLVKRYSSSVRIGPIDLSLAAGEFLSLLGPSGCGKSTLLRCIAGFEHVDAGDILIGGRSILKDAPNRRNVGYVFQNYALFPHLSVADNVAFGLRRRSIDRTECAHRTGEILERVGLEKHAQRRPSELSGGQQQRVALARVLVLDPAVLLLDEPLSSLDRQLRIQMRAEFKRVHREFKKTIVYVTHDQEEALALSDRIAVMLGHGGVTQCGTPMDIYESPVSEEVADFLGDCNVYSARIHDVQEGRVELSGPAGCRWHALSRGRSFSPGTAVTVMFRPDRVRLGPPDEPDPGCVFNVRLAESSYAGERITYTGSLDTGEPVRVTLPVDQSRAALPHVEATCHVGIDNVFVFERSESS